jgi:hypothetical protein
MQTVDVTMASRPLLKVGKYHLAALGQNEATRGLAIAFKPTVDALAVAKAGREQAEDALIEPRATARFAEAALEVVLREIAALAHTMDNKASGDLVFRAIFPNGLDAEVRPRGPAQLSASMALRERLNSQRPAVAVKEQSLQALDAGLATLGSALEKRRAAEQALGIARAAEDGARETFVSSYDSNAGAIRQMFPRNRARQDLYFDQFRAGSSASDDSEPDPSPTPTTDPKKT